MLIEQRVPEYLTVFRHTFFNKSRMKYFMFFILIFVFLGQVDAQELIREPEREESEAVKRFVRTRDSLHRVLSQARQEVEGKESQPGVMDRYVMLQDQLQKKEVELVFDLLREAPDSEYTAAVYYDMLDLLSERMLKYSDLAAFYQGYQEVERVYRSFSPKVQKSKYGVLIRKYLGHRSILQEGKQAPAFVVKDLEGKVLRLSDLKGKYVLLDFWDSYCEACLKMMPEVSRIAREYGTELDVVSVSLDEDAELCRATVQKYGCPGQVVCCGDEDENRQVAEDYLVGFLPTYVLISPKGKLIIYNGVLPEIEKILFSQCKSKT